MDSPCGLDDNLPKQIRHRLKTRAKSRAQKLIADYYTLSGLIDDAMELYSIVPLI
jgi:hypothetical protein